MAHPTAGAGMLEWPRDARRARGLIDGPSGPLEAAVSLPGQSPRGLALVCHPHPQYGGAMDNKVVTMLARAANETGLSAVRFNFRGVGDSAGEYDGGRGELEDARAARDWARSASGLPVAMLAGFSFGSMVALRLAESDPVPALVTVGLPAEYFESALPRPDTDWLALFGSDDDVIDVDTAIGRVRALSPPPEVVVMEGAGHFLHGRLTQLRRHVRTFVGDSGSTV